MFTQLPEHLDPWRAADRGLSLSGAVPLRTLHRLRDLLLVAEGDAAYQMRFERDERGRPLIRGSVATELVVECQRCLGPLKMRVDAELRLVAVRGLEEAGGIEEPLEPLLAEADLCRPLDLIEEELLLALPHVPLHPEGTCRTPTQPDGATGMPEAAPSASGSEHIRPFAALAGLKTHTKH